jgi:hypothetical protein
MPIDNVVDLVTITDPGLWSPDRFQAYQQQDYLDLRASFPSGTTPRALRLYANGDLQVAGEMFLRGGQIRGDQTLTIAVLEQGEDVVSFRQGEGPGTEVLRIEESGTIASAWASGLRLRSRGLVELIEGEDALPVLFTLFSDRSPAPEGTQPFLVLATGTGIPPDAFLSVYRKGTVRIVSEAGYPAEIELDAEAENEAEGKLWAVSADTGGDLLFANRSAGGGTAAVAPSGALRPVVREDPPAAGNNVGDIVFDTVEMKLLVCVSAGDPGDWEIVTTTEYT